jgi:hypothetical protein
MYQFQKLKTVGCKCRVGYFSLQRIISQYERDESKNTYRSRWIVVVEENIFCKIGADTAIEDKTTQWLKQDMQR